MKTLRLFLYREILIAVGFVTLGFLSLFLLFDFVDELKWAGRVQPGDEAVSTMLAVSLSIPTHLYELLPITVLIGTIYVMARLAQSSEFTIMRTSGLGPWQALRTLLGLGLAFVVLTFAVGDYLAPVTDRAAQLLRARFDGGLTVGQTGAWLKEKQGDRSFVVNVGALVPNGELKNIRIFEFDSKWHTVSQTTARTARFAPDNVLRLEGVHRTTFGAAGGTEAAVVQQAESTRAWPTQISAEMVAASLLKPDRMRTVDLFQYIRHLDANGQAAQRYEIEFWRKVFYPLSCLVMVVLALPFGYLHFRSRGIAIYVFGGVMAGISFFLLNNVFGYIGNLQNWQPWLAAGAPGLLYSGLSLGAFGWLVLKR